MDKSETKMEKPSRLKGIDPSSITGPFQLLALFLLVAEGLLAYWLFRAESTVERGLTGLVMLLIFLGLVYAVIQITRASSTHTEPGMVPPPIKPPEGSATKEEIDAPPPETIPAPDRSYLINMPPENWSVRELSTAELTSETIGIKDNIVKQSLGSKEDQERNILFFERKKTSIIPTPGQTTIEGQKIPTALEFLVSTSLTIIPIARAQPPLFVERPLEHNFFSRIGLMLIPGNMTLQNLESGYIGNTGRHYIEADLQQEIRNAIVDGKENQDAVFITRCIGIEGDLIDHLLIIMYLLHEGDPEVKADLQTLQTLVDSFRPIRIINAEEKRKEIAAQADEKFKELMAENGEDIFKVEFRFQLLRLQGVNLEDPEARLHAMKSFKPFEVFAREINLHNENLDGFWETLHQAELGDATNFKAFLAELLSEKEEEKAEQAIGPPEPDRDRN